MGNEKDGGLVEEPRSSTKPLLSLQGIVKTYASGDGEVRVLDGVDLEVAVGEFIAVKGPSGAGKSTLLHIAAGLDSPTSGRVLFDGQALNDLTERELTKLRRNQFGFVFQFFNLVSGLDVRDNIALPLLLDGAPRRLAAQTTAELIDAVGLTHRADHLAGDLSGGEMQRTAVARAIAPGPSVIFADEPTGNLDSHSGEMILDLLANLCSQYGSSLLMVTHDDRAARRAGRTVEVSDGRLLSVTPAAATAMNTASAAGQDSR